MKKLFLALFAVAVFTAFSFAAAKENETPSSIYAKVIDRSYIGKYQSIIIDKELSSTRLPQGITVKSKTYFAGGKFREETKTKDADDQTMDITTIFTPSDTYISYDGENYFSLGSAFIDEISENLKNIDPFSPFAVLQQKLETMNGAECYVIEDNAGGVNRKFYIEKKTYNVVKSVISNDEFLIVTDMSNYKKVNKYTAPFAIKLLVKQKTGEKEVVESAIKITSVQFNPAIEADMFTPKNVIKLPNINIPGIGNVKDIIQSIF
ncbi:MAG: hypothetical protein FWH43_08150 [Endomicrobia bacterium]|nr:hypothetical protein [Endomicrobiia bacterium]